MLQHQIIYLTTLWIGNHACYLQLYILTEGIDTTIGLYTSVWERCFQVSDSLICFWGHHYGTFLLQTITELHLSNKDIIHALWGNTVAMVTSVQSSLCYCFNYYTVGVLEFQVPRAGLIKTSYHRYLVAIDSHHFSFVSIDRSTIVCICLLPVSSSVGAYVSRQLNPV